MRLLGLGLRVLVGAVGTGIVLPRVRRIGVDVRRDRVLLWIVSLRSVGSGRLLALDGDVRALLSIRIIRWVKTSSTTRAGQL